VGASAARARAGRPGLSRAVPVALSGRRTRDTPGETVERDGNIYTLPARYDARGLFAARSTARDDTASFFHEVTIFAPSPFNSDFVMTVNGEFSFVPTFWQDGSPGFSGICAPTASGRATGERSGPPWLFQGYLSI
jgi:hypothetical protein